MSTRIPQIPDNAFLARVPLRWGDMDSLGHVNNVIFLRLLEEARIQLLADLPRRNEHGYGLLTARHEIDYLKPLHYSKTPAAIHTWVEKVGTASFIVAHVVVDPAGDAVCAAKSVVVSIDAASGQAVAMPQLLRTALEPFTDEAS